MLLAGCASNAALTGTRSGGLGPKRAFWPPPPSSFLWVADTGPAVHDVTLRQAGQNVATLLRRQGYLQQRWFPIGAEFVHGFAVSTKLEQVDGQTKPAATDRWISWHPEPATLFWIAEATSVRLPPGGRYRLSLVAFTDLPMGATTVAPVWGPETIMAGPEVPEMLTEGDLPRGRHVRGARVGVYTYFYESGVGGDAGRRVPDDAIQPPERQALAESAQSTWSPLSARRDE